PIIVVAFFLRHAVSFPHHTQQPCPAEREWPTGPGEQATDGRKRLTDRRKLVTDRRKLVTDRRNVVGVTGFEPATSSSRTTRATKLRHTPEHSMRRDRAMSGHDPKTAT